MANQQPEALTTGVHEVLTVADDTRSWTNKQSSKEMLSYRVKLKAPDGTEHARVELAQLETTAAPKAGDKLDGSITKRFYEAQGETKSDLQFKKASRGGGFGGGGGGRAWKPRPDDAPVVYAAKQAQIVAQHSQNMAIRVLELAAAHSETGDFSGIMADLGVPLSFERDGDTVKLGLVDAFQRHASIAAGEAWKREEEKGRVAKALADLS